MPQVAARATCRLGIRVYCDGVHNRFARHYRPRSDTAFVTRWYVAPQAVSVLEVVIRAVGGLACVRHRPLVVRMLRSH